MFATMFKLRAISNFTEGALHLVACHWRHIPFTPASCWNSRGNTRCVRERGRKSVNVTKREANKTLIYYLVCERDFCLRYILHQVLPWSHIASWHHQTTSFPVLYFKCCTLQVVMVLNESFTSRENQVHSVISLLHVVHMELWSYQRGYLSAACPAEEPGRGGWKVWHTAWSEAQTSSSCYQWERLEEKKHNGGGRREHGSRAVCVCVYAFVCVYYWGSPALSAAVSANLHACGCSYTWRVSLIRTALIDILEPPGV